MARQWQALQDDRCLLTSSPTLRPTGRQVLPSCCFRAASLSKLPMQTGRRTPMGDRAYMGLHRRATPSESSTLFLLSGAVSLRQTRPNIVALYICKFSRPAVRSSMEKG